MNHPMYDSLLSTGIPPASDDDAPTRIVVTKDALLESAAAAAGPRCEDGSASASASSFVGVFCAAAAGPTAAAEDEDEEDGGMTKGDRGVGARPTKAYDHDDDDGVDARKPSAGIAVPSAADVLLSGLEETNNSGHPGNQRYNDIVKFYKALLRQALSRGAGRQEQRQIAANVVRQVKASVPPARFLKLQVQDEETTGPLEFGRRRRAGMWYEVDEDRAIEAVEQDLRGQEPPEQAEGAQKDCRNDGNDPYESDDDDDDEGEDDDEDSDDDDDDDDDEGEEPSEGIAVPSETDVLFGRGGGTKKHAGNVRYRRIVRRRKADYRGASIDRRRQMVAEILREVKSSEPPAKYLKRLAPCDDLWYEVNSKRVRLKVLQALREKKAPAERADSAKAENVVTVKKPNPQLDFMMGQLGGMSTNNPANKQMRDIVNDRKKDYHDAESNEKKNEIIEEAVEEWKRQVSAQRRFLSPRDGGWIVESDPDLIRQAIRRMFVRKPKSGFSTPLRSKTSSKANNCAATVTPSPRLALAGSAISPGQADAGRSLPLPPESLSYGSGSESSFTTAGIGRKRVKDSLKLIKPELKKVRSKGVPNLQAGADDHRQALRDTRITGLIPPSPGASMCFDDGLTGDTIGRNDLLSITDDHQQESHEVARDAFPAATACLQNAELEIPDPYAKRTGPFIAVLHRNDVLCDADGCCRASIKKTGDAKVVGHVLKLKSSTREGADVRSMAESVIADVRNMKPPGRFVMEYAAKPMNSPEHSHHHGNYYEIENTVAIDIVADLFTKDDSYFRDELKGPEDSHHSSTQLVTGSHPRVCLIDTTTDLDDVLREFKQMSVDGMAGALRCSASMSGSPTDQRHSSSTFVHSRSHSLQNSHLYPGHLPSTLGSVDWVIDGMSVDDEHFTLRKFHTRHSSDASRVGNLPAYLEAYSGLADSKADAVIPGVGGGVDVDGNHCNTKNVAGYRSSNSSLSNDASSITWLAASKRQETSGSASMTMNGMMGVIPAENQRFGYGTAPPTRSTNFLLSYQPHRRQPSTDTALSRSPTENLRGSASIQTRTPFQPGFFHSSQEVKRAFRGDRSSDASLSSEGEGPRFGSADRRSHSGVPPVSNLAFQMEALANGAEMLPFALQGGESFLPLSAQEHPENDTENVWPHAAAMDTDSTSTLHLPSDQSISSCDTSELWRRFMGLDSTQDFKSEQG